jgi:hypothetical protein
VVPRHCSRRPFERVAAGPVRAEALNLLAAVRLHADSYLRAVGLLQRGLVCVPTAGRRCGSSEGAAPIHIGVEAGYLLDRRAARSR